jgi:hypothetical protein
MIDERSPCVSKTRSFLDPASFRDGAIMNARRVCGSFGSGGLGVIRRRRRVIADTRLKYRSRSSIS